MRTMEPILDNTGRTGQADRAPGEVDSLEARHESLLKLVGELLKKNEQLRMQVERLKALTASMPCGMI